MILQRKLAASTTHELSHKYQFREAGKTNILKHDNTDEDATIFTS